MTFLLPETTTTIRKYSNLAVRELVWENSSQGIKAWLVAAAPIKAQKK